MALRRLMYSVEHIIFRSCFLSSRVQIRLRSNKAIEAAKAREEAGLEPIDEQAYNYIERKNGLFKPKHTVEEQIAYMNSEGLFCLSDIYFKQT